MTQATETSGSDEHFAVSRQQKWWCDGAPAVVAVTVALPNVAPGAVRRGLATEWDRHEALRTLIERRPELRDPVQVVLHDLGQQWHDDLEAIDDLVGQATPLVAATASEQSVTLLRLAANAAVADVTSLLVLATAAAGGIVQEDPLQYLDFAAWQGELLAASDGAGLAAAAYWRHCGDGPRAAQPAAWSSTDVAASTPSMQRVAALADEVNVPLDDVLLALWTAVAVRMTGETDARLLVHHDGRASTELAGAIGRYDMSLPQRVQGAATMSVRELVTAVARGRQVPSDHLLRPPVTAPTARFAFVSYRDGCVPAAALLDVLSPTPLESLQLVVLPTDDGATLRIQHSTSQAADARAAAVHLAAVLEGMEPDAAVRSLPIWPAGRENRALLAAEPAADLGPGWTWSSAVRAHAATRPEASAVVGRSGALNYAELNDLADRVAASLQARGVRRGDVVAMLLPNDTDVAVAILAAHRAGASYLPLHVDHPVERLRYQIEDAGVKVAIASSDLSSRLPYGIEVVSVASLVETAGDLVDPGEHDDAYLIYTSGSTGAPKGVVITHGNLAAYAAGVVARLSLTGVPTSCAAVTSLATDLALTAVSVAWATGGALHLVDPATAGDGAALAQRFAAQRPDLLKVTPSHLRGLLAAGGPGVLPTRTLVFGGEALPWDLVEQVRSLRDCDIVNHYGPSETTVGAFAQVLPRDAARTTATVPIGTPLPSYRAYVLDTEGVEVPEGAPGELVIGGTAVSLAGYLGQPQLTEQRFGVADGVRTYRTGDRVRVTSHGVEFLGRIDDQLKIRGFRVEPGEVEAALADQVGVDACAVVGRADQPGGLRLVGYVVGAVRSAADVQSLRSALLERLPEHAVPSLIVPIAALPLLPNGKVDRGALPDPETLRLVDEAAYVAPRTPIEEALATIWSELLHVERVGVEDDFFALGGHSLLATQIIARILAQFGVQLPLHSLFVAPNVAALAQLVAEHQQGAPEDDDLVEVLRTIEQLSDEQAAGLLESGSA